MAHAKDNSSAHEEGSRMQLIDEQIRALLRDPARHPPSARHLGFEQIDFSVAERWAR